MLVTGAGRGIGRACAVALAGEGAVLTLTARSEPELEEVRDLVHDAGGRAVVTVADATAPMEVGALVAMAHDRQPLWGCVHAAGANRSGPTVRYSVADFDHVLSANARSTFLVLQAAARGMLEHGEGGRLVAISSQMGAVGYPGRAAYCASKHAVNGLVKALAVEWATAGVTVNAVAPTFVATRLTEAALSDPAFASDVTSRIPAGRLGTVEEVAAAAAFLLTPSASLVTGAILAADGGWTAW